MNLKFTFDRSHTLRRRFSWQTVLAAATGSARSPIVERRASNHTAFG